MTWLIRSFYIALLAFIVGSAIYLMYGDIPAPLTNIEKTIPSERFKQR